MAVLVIEQPNYLPWIGYFDLLDQADIWVWLDDVQYTRRDWRSRNRVAGATGEPRWLTIPVRSKGRRDQLICEAEIDHEQSWIRKHLDTVRHCYHEAPFFDVVYSLLESRLETRPRLLSDLTIPLCEDIAKLLQLSQRTHRSSELTGVDGKKQERLLQIHSQVGGETYLSGPAAEDYIDPEGFLRAGIDLRYIEYNYSGYPRGSGVAQSALSIVDPLMWLGPEATRNLWRSTAASRRS